MKNLIVSLSFLGMFITLESCCDNRREVPHIMLQYLNLAEGTSIYVQSIREIDNTIDTNTAWVGQVNSSLSNRIKLPLYDEHAIYLKRIIFCSDSLYFDTITDVSFTRKDNCKESVENLQYYWNGQLRTDKEIVIE